MTHKRVPLFLAILFWISNAHSNAADQPTANAGWKLSATPFRSIAVASNGTSIWACGVNEGIATSGDGGAHWQLKHIAPDGNLLMSIQFENDKFGYAAGTGGSILTTEDGGENWTPHPGPNKTVLQISFSDAQHGLVRTPDDLQFTADSGKTWSPISPVDDPNVLKKFPYTFSLVAIDSAHMAVMLKQGAAQYESQAFLVTDDSGKTWKVINIPSVTLYSFLSVRGKYWTVGTEVVGKDRPGGGHGVPVALYSTDGVNWVHSTNDLSACRMEMCVACTPWGCLSSNGTITNFFGQGTTYRTFASEPKLTPKWTATDSAMCFVGSSVFCSPIKSAEKSTTGEGPVPATVAPGRLGVAPSTGPHCVSCEMDQMLVDPKIQGLFTVKLSLEIGRDGTVRKVEVDGAPTPLTKSRLERQAQQWLFEPYTKDGVRVNLKLNTQVQVNVIHPR